MIYLQGKNCYIMFFLFIDCHCIFESQQLGSRITSKRVSQMIEDSFPCSYIMVDRHPCRHDPSHILTHRIQSTITQFADSLRKAKFPPRNKKWSVFLRALDMVVSVVLQ